MLVIYARVQTSIPYTLRTRTIHRNKVYYTQSQRQLHQQGVLCTDKRVGPWSPHALCKDCRDKLPATPLGKQCLKRVSVLLELGHQ